MPASRQQRWDLGSTGLVPEPVLSASVRSCLLHTHSAVGCPAFPQAF